VDLAHSSLLGAIRTVMSRTYGTHITNILRAQDPMFVPRMEATRA
jgi:hypothetical protein